MNYHITLDIDWAPDLAICHCLEILKEKKIKATFFATHKTDLLKEIQKDGHEIGIHPNFAKNSSHGISTEKVIENCLKIVPNAKLIRTHGLIHSTKLIIKIFKEFPQLKIDISTFTYHFPTVSFFQLKLEGLIIERLNYNWEDDTEFENKSFNWNKSNLFGKFNILNFHPIHVYLNSQNSVHYKNLLKELNNKKLYLAKRKILENHINSKKKGTKDFLYTMISSNNKSIKLRDIK